MSNNAYIVSAVRTAGGKKNGSLSQWIHSYLMEQVITKMYKDLQTKYDN